MKKTKLIIILGLLTITVLTRCNRSNNSLEEVVCTAEQVSDDSNKFVSEKKFIDLTFNNGRTRSAEMAHSGKYSCKLSKKNPYGMTYSIRKVKPKEQYEISVYRKTPSKKAVLIIATPDPKNLYLSISDAIETDEKGWDLLQYKLTIPEKLNGMDVAIYTWLQDTINNAYFDDLSIKFLGQK